MLRKQTPWSLSQSRCPNEEAWGIFVTDCLSTNVSQVTPSHYTHSPGHERYIDCGKYGWLFTHYGAGLVLPVAMRVKRSASPKKGRVDPNDPADFRGRRQAARGDAAVPPLGVPGCFQPALQNLRGFRRARSAPPSSRIFQCRRPPRCISSWQTIRMSLVAVPNAMLLTIGHSYGQDLTCRTIELEYGEAISIILPEHFGPEL